MAEHTTTQAAGPAVIGAGMSPGCGDTLPASLVPLLSVILVGQRSLAQQRHGRYVAGSGAHPARMAPDLATALINDYTKPGDLVFDPLAGTGTTLVEAIHAGRNALGMEYEPGWVALARANIDLARRQGGTGHGRVLRGDATTLPRGVSGELHGQISLVLTSPPYGKTMHGRVEHRRGPLTRFHNTYSRQPHRLDASSQATASAASNPANLAYRGRAGLLDGITAVLAGCRPLLKPGGVIAVVTRPWRRDHVLVDLPGQTIQAGLAAGLELIACRRAVHAAVRDGRLAARHSFFQLHVARASRRKNIPVSLIQHDDIAVFQAPTSSASSGEPKCSQRDPKRSRRSLSHVDASVHGEADGLAS
ncbi:DNA methyltransferase [Dactylosporangium sp. NPDC049140]|uniref:TRM11 family SAM-dependent methyltransferase n=1 Tax=Dactylosporangium sp. NPDC049140 TaxID=3155647 RepID=UPI00340A8AB3